MSAPPGPPGPERADAGPPAPPRAPADAPPLAAAPARPPGEVAALEVVRALRAAGHVAYFAGGSVRDRLLGRPHADVDVATSARPEVVQATFRRTVPVGVQFGIVIVNVRVPGLDGRATLEGIEVATFRADAEYRDGRRPEGVRFTDAEEDARRRDFTINGMFYDPLDDRVIDFVGGRDDVRRGLVRAIGDPEARFAEDRLRILRAPRFAAALGFRLDPATEDAARRHAPEVHDVSQERIHDELDRILAAPTRARGFALCRALGLLEAVLPEALVDADRAERALGLLPPAAPPALAWAAALHPAGPDRCDAALRRLRAANALRERAVALVAGLAVAEGFAARPLAERRRFLRRPEADDLPALARAAALAAAGDLAPVRRYRAELAAFAADPGPAGRAAAPLVRGADLQAAGLRPGPAFGRILAATEDAQLEGRVADRPAALAFALALARASAPDGAPDGAPPEAPRRAR